MSPRKHSLFETILARISLGAVPIDGEYWFDPKAAGWPAPGSPAHEWRAPGSPKSSECAPAFAPAAEVDWTAASQPLEHS